MKVTYGRGFEVEAKPKKVEALLTEMLQMPQYEPTTKHYFHAGMYCREVWRDAGVVIVGKVHKKEHFYFVASGTVVITSDDGVQRVTGPHMFLSKPGTRRAVYAETPALCLTFHVTDAATVEDAEAELVEPEPNSAFDAHNRIKQKEVEVIE